VTRAKLAFLIALASGPAILCSGSELGASSMPIVETTITWIVNCWNRNVRFFNAERREEYTFRAPPEPPATPDGKHCNWKIFDRYPIDKAWKVPWAVNQKDFDDGHYIFVHILQPGPCWTPPPCPNRYWIYQSRESDGNFVRYSPDGQWRPLGPVLCCQGSHAGGTGSINYSLTQNSNYWVLQFTK
jgi:hypothetical protein